MGLKFNILLAILLVLIYVSAAGGLRLSGTNFRRTDPDTDSPFSSPHFVLHSSHKSQHMVFLGRFVFEPNGEGLLYYDIIIAANYCCPDIVVFSDWKNEWPALREQQYHMDCYEMIDRATLVISLWGESASCEPYGDDKVRCKGMRRFEYPLAQWYYVTAMNCHYQQNDGIELLDYNLGLVNHGRGLTEEFSADEDIQLAHQKMLHVTFRLWLGSLLLHTTGILILACGWLKFAHDGITREDLQLSGYITKSVGNVVFASMLVLMSKGYTITRLTMRDVGKMKFVVFVTGFSICHVTLYIIQLSTDPQEVHNIYDTPAALGLIVIRIIGTAWGLYGTYFTIKDFPSKREFYSVFILFVIFWFMSEPVVAFLSTFCLPLYCRAKFVFGFDVGVVALGHFIFLWLIRPSSTNTFFPFHLKTNKVSFEFLNELQPKNNYRPTTETFDLFLAKKDDPAASSKDDTKKTDKSTDDQKPSKGSYDIFMTGKPGTKNYAEDKRVNCMAKLPPIKIKIPLESMIKCPVEPPKNLPVKYLEDEVTYTPVEDLRVTYTAVDDLRIKPLKSNKRQTFQQVPRTTAMTNYKPAIYEPDAPYVSNHKQPKPDQTLNLGKHCGPNSSELKVENKLQRQSEAQKRGKLCGPLAFGFQVENELQHGSATNKTEDLGAAKRRIQEMRAALAKQEMEYQRKLSEANCDSLVGSEMDVEKGDMYVTVKKKKRNPIHKAQKVLGMKKSSEQR
ncbi:putative transmembrane protein [Apostichopus japonicus]|uniref:Putative transmembrane protein n=1 Tax=Stichopus japonicus TaxID=307972 RepID=A0A2G8JZT3_STIJA|nr:putative transmembrane protein [Apostichopus japonicus]